MTTGVLEFRNNMRRRPTSSNSSDTRFTAISRVGLPRSVRWCGTTAGSRNTASYLPSRLRRFRDLVSISTLTQRAQGKAHEPRSVAMGGAHELVVAVQLNCRDF